MAQFSWLVQQTQLRLSMQGGVGVQVYAEDRIAAMLEYRFDVLFDKFWWNDYYELVQSTLGEGGVPVWDTSAIGLTRYSDIHYLYYKDRIQPVPELLRSRNPKSVMVQDSESLFRGPYHAQANKIVRLYPYGTAGDDFSVMYRRMPSRPFAADDEVVMDAQAMILGAVYDYLEDDGTNPAATQKFLALSEERVATLRANEEDVAVPINPGGYVTSDGYQVVS